MKKKISGYLNDITFEEAYYKISREDIDYLIKGDSNAKFSISLKKFLFLLLGSFMPTMMLVSYIFGNKNISTTPISRALAIIIAVLFILILLVMYFKSNSLFKNYNYKSFIYTSLKVLFLSYICGSIGTVDNNYIVNLLTISIYIPICLYLYYSVENNMIAEHINILFEKKYKTQKILSLLVSLVGVVVFLGIIVVQLYRMNKWWIEKVSIENTINDLGLGAIITIVTGTLIMISISLVPTYFGFKADLYIKNKLVMKYSEEFREVYGYYKQEWDL